MLGQRTAAKGYNSAPVIENGRLNKDYGGGISQVSTTTFNATFFSGVRIEEYLPHSFYISRYPEGREATISWPDVDKWLPTTPATGSSSRPGCPKLGHGDLPRHQGLGHRRAQGAAPQRRPAEDIIDDKAGCVPSPRRRAST